MGEAFDAACGRLDDAGMPVSSAKSSPSALSMLQKKVNAIPSACAILPLPLSDEGDRDVLAEGPSCVKSRSLLYNMA
ncbi:MAG: hypothetical protein ACLPX7_04890 [Xanthobacteraceae bacterium]